MECLPWCSALRRTQRVKHVQLGAIFAMKKKRRDGSAQAGKKQEGQESHDQAENHDEGEAFGRVEKL